MGDAITDESIQGLGHLKKVFAAFEKLAPVGTERDTANNRTLFYSQYASLILLSMFNPAMQCVRGLSDASALKKVQRLIGGGRVSIGSLSESVRVFDPQLLQPIIEGLLADLPQHQAGAGPHRNIPETIPQELAAKLLATDGSSLRALPQIVNAIGARDNGKWKLHLQFRVLNGTSSKAVITPDETGGEDDERNVLAKNLERDHIYLADRGYERYSLLTSIVRAGSHYVIRCQERPVDVIEERELSQAAREARVISDQIVRLGKSRSEVGAVDHPVRRIVIEARSQGKHRASRPSSDRIVLLTSLMDVPAEVIAAMYSLRWSIELFFRWLKHLLGCRHLLSEKPQGVAIQIYCALIACLLLAQITGASVGRRAFNLVCLYLQGWADADELAEGLARIRASQKPRKNR
jgi:hypothetical protein